MTKKESTSLGKDYKPNCSTGERKTYAFLCDPPPAHGFFFQASKVLLHVEALQFQLEHVHSQSYPELALQLVWRDRFELS
jgi:hypothetical protein